MRTKYTFKNRYFLYMYLQNINTVPLFTKTWAMPTGTLTYTIRKYNIHIFDSLLLKDGKMTIFSELKIGRGKIFFHSYATKECFQGRKEDM
jgi:hypothetical protein